MPKSPVGRLRFFWFVALAETLVALVGTRAARADMVQFTVQYDIYGDYGGGFGWIVPTGVTAVSFELWGNGGAGGRGGIGGAGGFASGTFSVTPGELITGDVGTGRQIDLAGTELMGHAISPYGENLAIAIAGAGGLGGVDGDGGAGGGFAGQSGTGTNAGAGGTQGGPGGPFDAFDVGYPSHFSNAGEGHWNGGTAIPTPITQPDGSQIFLYGGGGGGSGYVDQSVWDSSLLTGTGPVPPAMSFPGYILGVGFGGASDSPGGDGEVVLIYNVVPEPSSLALSMLALAALTITAAVRRRWAIALASRKSALGRA